MSERLKRIWESTLCPNRINLLKNSLDSKEIQEQLKNSYNDSDIQIYPLLQIYPKTIRSPEYFRKQAGSIISLAFSNTSTKKCPHNENLAIRIDINFNQEDNPKVLQYRVVQKELIDELGHKSFTPLDELVYCRNNIERNIEIAGMGEYCSAVEIEYFPVQV